MDVTIEEKTPTVRQNLRTLGPSLVHRDSKLTKLVSSLGRPCFDDVDALPSIATIQTPLNGAR